jgi:hypothetical protein
MFEAIWSCAKRVRKSGKVGCRVPDKSGQAQIPQAIQLRLSPPRDDCQAPVVPRRYSRLLHNPILRCRTSRLVQILYQYSSHYDFQGDYFPFCICNTANSDFRLLAPWRQVVSPTPSQAHYFPPRTQADLRVPVTISGHPTRSPLATEHSPRSRYPLVSNIPPEHG